MDQNTPKFTIFSKFFIESLLVGPTWVFNNYLLPLRTVLNEKFKYTSKVPNQFHLKTIHIFG